MMGSLELPGTCFARYEYTAFPSKADQIMSKYRPIAPKPILVTPTPSDSNSNASPNSHSRFTTRKGSGGTESGRSCRAPRRKASECSNSPSPKAQKRVRVPNNAAEMVSESIHVVGRTAHGSLAADGSRTVYPSDVCFRPEKLPVERDSGLMERAATTSFSALGKTSAGFGGRLSIKETANSVGEVGMEDPFINMEVVRGQKLPQESSKYLVFPIVGDVDQQQEDERARNLVTLPLLREKPSLEDSIVGSPAANSTSTVGDPDQKPINNKLSYDKKEIQFRLFGRDFSIKDAGPCKSSSYESAQHTSSVPVADFSVIEKMYTGSHNPVILLLYNDSHGQDVLWSNPAYKKMIRELESDNFQTNQPHTIIPIPYVTFSFKSVSLGTANSKAILWGFVENFTWPETERSLDHGISDNREHKLMPGSSSSFGHHHHNHISMDIYSNAVSWMPSDGEGIIPVNKGVIMPQPIRPVGSCVSIEYIEEANPQSSPICKTMDEIEKQIETETFPALVADSKNKVKCANSAYKEMVGQPECTWLESAAHCYNNKSEASSNSFAVNRINGEVVLKHETPIPTSAFSCCARIQWTNNKGEKSAIRAPCNVIKRTLEMVIKYSNIWTSLLGWGFYFRGILTKHDSQELELCTYALEGERFCRKRYFLLFTTSPLFMLLLTDALKVL